MFLPARPTLPLPRARSLQIGNRNSRASGNSAIGWMIMLAPLLCQNRAALADEAPSEAVDQVQVLGTRASVAVDQAVLDAGSPQSVIGPEVIHQITAPTGDYGIIANLTPSFVSTAPNGPGFDAAKNQSLRGFVDGQFNVTLDGIPFADPDNFQHHSTSYFPSSMLDQVVIDRSPGGAADLGYASFGGSVNLYSQALPETARARLFANYGSFATSLFGVTLNTAAPQASGQTGILGTIEHTQSSGAMDNTPGWKDDFLMKSVSWLGDARLTALYTYDRYHFYNPGSITTTQLAQYGSSFGYNNDPGSPNYRGYADTHRTADFGYVKLEISLAGNWHLEDKVYTYSYRNRGLSVKGDQTSSPLGSGFAGFAPTDIAGRITTEGYRTVGNDARVANQGWYGAFLLGVWAEESHETQSRVSEDFTTGQLYNANKKAGSPYYFDFDSHLHTVEPYAEYAYQVTEAWKLRFGVRWRDVTRDFAASSIQNFLPGTQGTVSRTVSSTLPSFDTTYRLASDTNLFAQVAKGSLLPSQAFFYTANPGLGNQVNPENAVATQLGIVHQGPHYGLAFDAYNINFNNYVSTITQNGNTLYINSGRVRYRGLETEDHVTLGWGVTLLANASLIRATFQDNGMTSPIQVAGNTIPFAPNYTGLAGVVYGHGSWGASLLTKFIGVEYQGKNGSADGATYRVPSYSYTNATVTWIAADVAGLRNLRCTLGLNNLFNSDAITDNAGPSAIGPNLINVLPRRNFMLSVVADL
jgi:iron complex outermembrane recepter protein